MGVTVQDQYGNTITTGTGSTDHISVSLSPGNFATGTTTTATAKNGVATFSGLKINTLGSSYTITATDTTDTGLAAVQTNSFAVTAGTPSKLVFTSTVSGNQTVSSSATVGPFAVQVQDQFGNPATNTGGAVTLQLSSTSTGTTFFTPTSGGTTAAAVTIANGASTLGQLLLLRHQAGTPTITASVTVNGADSHRHHERLHHGGRGGQPARTSPRRPSGNQTVSATASVGPFAVQIEDQFGNPVTNAGGAVTLVTLDELGRDLGPHAVLHPDPQRHHCVPRSPSPTAPRPRRTSTTPTPWRAPRPSRVAGATVNGQAVTGDTTNGFTMVAGTANQLAFTTTVSGNQGVSPTATVGPFAVQVQDQFGNPVTNTGFRSVTLTLTSTSTGTTFFTTTSGGSSSFNGHHRRRRLDVIELLLLRQQVG